MTTLNRLLHERDDSGLVLTAYLVGGAVGILAALAALLTLASIA